MPTEFWARTDSNSANNPALNLTGDPAIQISFVPFGATGDVLLEYDGGAIDPDTQVQIGGTAYNFTFDSSSTLPTANNQGAGQVPDQYEGSSAFVIIVEDYPSPGETTRLFFLPEDTATEAEMEDFGNGAVRLQNIDTTTPGVICFAAGTLIDTPSGPVPVESLSVGDMVSTLDDGALPVVWMSTSTHQWPGSSEKHLPVLISADAIRPGVPRRDLVVSPLHKVLLSRAGTDSEKDQVLAPAKGLTALRGVRVMNGKRRITYVHVLLAKHALLISENLPTESFYPGANAMNALRPFQREEIFQVLPELTETDWPMARPCMTMSEAKALSDHIIGERCVAAT